ncbi:MAG TPA: hypothetical protein VGF70_07905 [Solirubrobacteraceae bacterium]
MSEEPEQPTTPEGPRPESAAEAPPEPPAEDPEAASSPPDSLERRALHEIVHLWIPLAIVLVSVCAAIVGWRASLSDESATHYEELSRQDLVQQQQLLVQDHNAVDSDVRVFGQFAQYSTLAESLLHDAGVVGGPTGDQLREQGAADLSVALTLGKQLQTVDYAFDPSNPAGNSFLREDGTYLPGHPYDADQGLATAENNDLALHGLEPEPLLAKAEAQHNKGVDFTGIAALFIGVLVLLTLGAVVKGTQKLWFAGSGAAVGLLAVLLFLATQLS